MMDDAYHIWQKHLLLESGLSRIHQHLIDYDAAMITAFRDSPLSSYACVVDPPILGKEEEKTLDINQERNKGLKAILLRRGYGVTRVDGTFIENFDKAPEERREVSEESFFVTNINDDHRFNTAMEALGRLFCQDSVLIIPKGGKDSYLLGTNDTSFPGLSKRELTGDFKGGEEAEFMSRIKKRPFAFKEISQRTETFDGLSRNSKWAVSLIAKRILNNKNLL